MVYYNRRVLRGFWMAKIKTVMLLGMQCLIAWLCSCVQVPMEYTLKNSVELSEYNMQQISDEIYEKLSEIDFAHPAGSTAEVDPKRCSDAYKIWLRTQFDKGLVPKKTITPAQYGNNSDPLISECRSVDLETEYKEAIKKNLEQNKLKGETVLMSFEQFQKDVNKNRCTGNFIDLNKEKIQVRGMYLNVIENTLSIRAPSYRIYTSFEENIVKEDIEEKGGEESMVKDETLMLLGNSREIKAKFVGKSLVDLNSDQQKLRDAEGPFTSLDGCMIAVPRPFMEAQTTIIDSETFYIVPSGSLKASLITQVNVRFSSQDAKCAFDRYKEKSKE